MDAIILNDCYLPIRGQTEGYTDFDNYTRILKQFDFTTEVAPAVEKVGGLETAAYESTMPAGSAIALDAYNNAEHAEVTKKTKRGCKTLELKHYLDRIEYTIEGGTLRFTALLPCGSGEALNLNPSLLTDFLRTQGAAPVWQCRVVRTHLYNKAGKDFE